MPSRLHIFVKQLGVRFYEWRIKYFPDRLFLLLMALIVGLLTGSCAYLLKCMIRWVSAPLTAHLHSGGPNLLFIIFPLVGIVLASIYQRYLLRDEISHGVDRLRRSLANNYVLPPHLMYAPLIASSLTLGCGGSAGSEGPIAYTGAAIGSNIGTLFKVSKQHMMILIACGAGAGIAGIFKAPIGGALFTIEVLAISLSSVATIALFISALTSALTAFVWSGCTPDVAFNDIIALGWEHTGAILIMGVAMGIYSAYYATIMKRMTHFYGRMTNPWMKNICSGLTVGILLFLFPTLYGEGYGAVAKLLADMPGNMLKYTWLANIFGNGYGFTILLMIVALGIMIAKPFATSSTNSGGGVAGDFAPTIMIGSVAGFLFATFSNYFFGTHLPVVDFVFLGMTGVMAGAIGAPVMAIFLTAEMATGYSLMLPATIVAALSFLTERLLTTGFRHFWANWYQSWNEC